MNRRILLIGCGVVALGCVACIGLFAVIGGGIFFLTQDIANASDEYLEALKQGDYQTAYDLSAPNVQNELGGVEGLQQFVNQTGFMPDSWNFNNRSIENNTGQLIGVVTLQNGTIVNTTMNFQKIDGDWRVTGLDFSQQ